jgi:RimJ/RimL family protein N-acetyltransferase
MAPAEASFVIQEITESDLDVFFQYLKEQLSENGEDHCGYFVPLPKGTRDVPPDKERSFRDGLTLPVGALGWRRIWAARTAEGRMAGHVDLRSHPQPFTEHRCLLGLGVGLHHRQRGLGALLLSHAIRWARESTQFEWIDLQVLSVNHRAQRLYSRAGFTKTGETVDMFRIDGTLLSETTMTRRIRESHPG